MIKKIKNFFFKANDYDRVVQMYISLLDYASLGRLSKTNYSQEFVQEVISKAQSYHHYSVVIDDLTDMINSGCSTEDVEEYLNNLEK